MTQLRIRADLAFSVTGSDAGGPSTPSLFGTVRADGTHVVVHSDDLLSLSAGRGPREVNALAAGLARTGLTVSLSGPGGPVATIGAVRSNLVHRVLTGSRHVRVDGWREAWRIRRAQRGTPGPGAPGLPPTTPMPFAPTFARRGPLTTTHDPLGGGRPQLVLATGPAAGRGASRKVFRLRREITRIGSAPDADLRLAGLAPRHAEIRCDDADEYRLVVVDGGAATSVNGAVAAQHLLRSGARVQLGEWRMSYWRDEYADHGRPYGGREGGELSHQRPQPVPDYRRSRTSRPDGPRRPT